MLKLPERIDTSNAGEWEQILLTQKDTQLDASALQYISSAGLRVLMKLQKTAGQVHICNVSEEVYEILELTGFASFLDVEEA